LAYRDLRDFISRLDKEGELRRISVEADPVLEITEITDRVTKAGGPALYFEKPKGSSMPVVTNLLGSERRMNLALDAASLDDVAARISSFLDVKSPLGFFDKLKMLPKLAEIGSFFPKTVKTGPCKEVIRKEGNFALSYFPVLKCWPQDGGHYITWPLVITANPENGKRNVGTYRMQIFDDASTGMHWQTQKHGAEHFRNARAQNPNGRLARGRRHRRRPRDSARRNSSRPA
jgi:4-hydroxy-3-polyprenylbenzoate decarboxylase